MLESLGTSFIPPPIIVAMASLWLLPIARWVEARLQYWFIKAYFSIAWILAVIASILWELYWVRETGPKHFYPVPSLDYRRIELIETTNTLLIALVISIIFFGVMLYSLKYLLWETLLEDEGTYKLYYYFLLYSSLIGALIVLFTNDAFTLFVGWEFMVLPGYALISVRPRARATEAAAKYALQSSIGSIFLLYGIATLYEITGTFNLSNMAAILSQQESLRKNITTWQAMTFIFIGIGVTAGFIGMQTWIPDAYGEAPSSVGAFISGTFAIVAIVALEKLILNVFNPDIYPYAPILLWGGVLTMTIGNLGAINQQDIRRFLGYSSIAQRGYLLFGLGIVATNYQNANAILKAVYAQGIAYAVLEGTLFLAVGNLLYLYFPILRTRDAKILRGSAKSHSLTSFAISICSLGLAGIPPTVGFVSKLSLIVVSGFSNISSLAFLLFIANSALSIYYYSRYIQLLVFNTPTPEVKEIEAKAPLLMNISIFILVSVSLVMSFKPTVWMGLL